MRKRAILSLITLLCFHLIVLPPTSRAYRSPQIRDEKFTQILRLAQIKLDGLHASLQFPGATVGFVLPDGRAGSVSTGVVDRESKIPLKPSDQILAGSIGKTFVAAETVLLVQEKKLSLDEKIARWIGNERWFGQLPNANEITLRMLLNHSSGIPNHAESKSFFTAATKNAETDIKYEDLLDYVLNKKPLFAAGQGFSYSDTNYILVGLIIEKVTGNTLYDEITRRFLVPLGLRHTIPSNNRSLLLGVNGYYEDKAMIKKGKFYINPQWEWAGGGFASTAEDLARWAKALYGGEVLTRERLDEMLNSTSIGDGASYGLGVEIITTKFGKAYGHDGEFPGYRSNMRYFPRYDIAVAAQVNGDEMSGANRFIATAVEDFAQLAIGELFAEQLSAPEKLRIQQTAEAWLHVVDQAKFADSWDGISAELQAKYPRNQWPAVIRSFRQKAGNFRARKFKSVFSSEEGTVAVEFESAFAKLPTGIETLIMKRGPDGRWRIASYSLR
ncbi:MAG: serine hydrolase [Pyrinomonadaceae bacterium]